MQTRARTIRLAGPLAMCAAVAFGGCGAKDDGARGSARPAAAPPSAPIPLDRLGDGRDPEIARRALAAVHAVRPVFRVCGDRVRESGEHLRRSVSLPVVIAWQPDGELAVATQARALPAGAEACFADAFAIAEADLARSWPLGIPAVSFNLCVAHPAATPGSDGGGA